MNKEELHKAAEEFHARWDNSWNQTYSRIEREYWYAFSEAFAQHIFPTMIKAELKSWTDDRIRKEVIKGYSWYEYFGSMNFRDELLKQLEG